METFSIDVLETIYFFGKIKYKERFLWWHSISQKNYNVAKNNGVAVNKISKGNYFVMT